MYRTWHRPNSVEEKRGNSSALEVTRRMNTLLLSHHQALVHDQCTLVAAALPCREIGPGLLVMSPQPIQEKGHEHPVPNAQLGPLLSLTRTLPAGAKSTDPFRLVAE